MTNHSQSGFKALLWALGMREGLTATSKAVLVALAARADVAGCCYPSMDRIAYDTRLSVRACQKAIPDLIAGGFLAVNRNTGRGHASVYKLNLKRPVDPSKGAPRSPIVGAEKAQLVHPLPNKRVHVTHSLPLSLKPERVNVVRVKGEPRAPHLPIELSSTAAPVEGPKSGRVKPDRNPRRSDPREAWHHLADRLPGGGAKIEETGADAGRAIVGGAYLDLAAELVCDAARIEDPQWEGDWMPLLTWLRNGFDLHESILPAIYEVASRARYSAPRSLNYFDRAVREHKRRWVARRSA